MVTPQPQGVDSLPTSTSLKLKAVSAPDLGSESNHPALLPLVITPQSMSLTVVKFLEHGDQSKAALGYLPSANTRWGSLSACNSCFQQDSRVAVAAALVVAWVGFADAGAFLGWHQSRRCLGRFRFDD